MRILAIDPGSEQSAYVVWDTDDDDGYIDQRGIIPNGEMLDLIGCLRASHVAIEMIASYGMPVGREIFDTILWIGQFKNEAHNEMWIGDNVYLHYRKDIKLHFCNSMRAKDSNIRQALIDRFGKPGTKKEPGLLYGVKKDEWQALALAIYAQDVLLEERP